MRSTEVTLSGMSDSTLVLLASMAIGVVVGSLWLLASMWENIDGLSGMY